LAGGAGLCFILYRLFGLVWGFIPIVIVVAFSLALTFYKPNDKPFVNMLAAAFKYGVQDKLYIWKKRTIKVNKNEYENTSDLEIEMKRQNLEKSMRLGSNRLRDLSWSLDILDLNRKEK
jgi:hypothetical protein